jgi:thiosulfate dehydrogenase [quinone] large subunit
MTTIIERRSTPVAGTPAVGAQPELTRRHGAADYVWAALRFALGWTFLWAFLDKAFGWGFATATEDAWVNGGSPTEGFLSFATTGPFEGFYQSIAGQGWADVLFMVGLAGIGTALLAGVAMRIAAGSGALLMLLMWTAVLPPENNPFMDDHLIYAGLLIGLALVGAGDTLGLGRVWAKTSLVRRLPWLR